MITYPVLRYLWQAAFATGIAISLWLGVVYP